jgi:hypothetical protein
MEKTIEEVRAEAPLQDAAVYLKQIAAEMRTIRQQMTEVVAYMRDAESEIPERLRRFMNYAHDCHDVKFMYEELGHPIPQHLKDELQRCDDRYRQVLKEMFGDGGPLDKVRREMASDPENRWDHTRQLQFKRSGL